MNWKTRIIVVTLAFLVAAFFTSGSLLMACDHAGQKDCKAKCEEKCKQDGKAECKAQCKEKCKDGCKGDCKCECKDKCKGGKVEHGHSDFCPMHAAISGAGEDSKATAVPATTAKDSDPDNK